MMTVLAAVAGMYFHPIDRDYDSKYYAWNQACTIQTEYSCEGILPPTVRFLNSVSYRGAYSGSDFILINNRLQPGKDKNSTLIHEMLHYLREQHERDYQFLKGVCDSEDFAFKYRNKWAKQVGWYDRPDWWKDYWKCWAWYAPNGYEAPK